MATLSWPFYNIYGCWSVVCQWSEITPYLFSLSTLPVNQMSFCSPFREIVISDVHGKCRNAYTGLKSVSSRLLFMSLWVWTQCKQLQTIILKVENTDLGACTSQRLCFFDSINDISIFWNSAHCLVPELLPVCLEGNHNGKGKATASKDNN